MGAAIGVVIAVTLILLAGCAGPEGSALAVRSVDYWGNRYPAACMRDLSDVDVPVMYVTPETLADINRQKFGNTGRRMLGWFNHSPRRIFIDKTLTGAQREEAVRHERCHVVAGEWHS